MQPYSVVLFANNTNNSVINVSLLARYGLRELCAFFDILLYRQANEIKMIFDFKEGLNTVFIFNFENQSIGENPQ